MSALFSNYRLGSLELRNRIVIAPMCQYSADEGRATDWGSGMSKNLVHFAGRT